MICYDSCIKFEFVYAKNVFCAGSISYRQSVFCISVAYDFLAKDSSSHRAVTPTSLFSIYDSLFRFGFSFAAKIITDIACDFLSHGKIAWLQRKMRHKTHVNITWTSFVFFFTLPSNQTRKKLKKKHGSILFGIE